MRENVLLHILCCVQVPGWQDVINLHILTIHQLIWWLLIISTILLCYCMPGAGGENQNTHSTDTRFCYLDRFSTGDYENCHTYIVFRADNYKCLSFQHSAKQEIPYLDMYLHEKSSSSNGEISGQIQVWWAWSIGMSRMTCHERDAEGGLLILKLRKDCNKYFR